MADGFFVPQQAIDIFEAGGSTTDVVEARILNDRGDPVAPRSARRWRRYWLDGVANPNAGVSGQETEITDEEVAAVFRLIKNKSLSLDEISDALDRSPSTVQRIVSRMEQEGYNVRIVHRRVEASTEASLRTPEPPKILFDAHHIRFGIYSDLHKGSREEQIGAFRHWMQYARDEGIEVFFGLGDYTAGRNVYRGQDLDLYLFTADEQLEALRQDLQPQPHETHILLGGNHDFAHLRNGSTDVVARFCADYPNVHFVGYDMADIPLTSDTGIRLWHPSGGKPYATSYRLQKGMEAMAYEQLLNLSREAREDNPIIKVIAAGHIHVDAKVHEGAVLGLQCACFEGQTNYLKRKSLYPQIGGYIVDLWIDDRGNIARERVEFSKYQPVDEDYRNYAERMEQLYPPARLEPVFTLA